MADKKNNRRAFIQKSAMAGLGLTLGGSIWAQTRSSNQSILASLANSTMIKRKLGTLEVTELGFGCMNVAWAYGNPPTRKESIQLIRSAYENGIRFFDTAEIYGPHKSEHLVGEALQEIRNEVVIASKIGFNIDFETGQMLGGLNSHPDHIKQAVEYMLKRLRTDRIDLLYQHRVDPNIPIEDVAGAFSDLIQEGKILHYGLSEAGAATIRRAHKVHPVTAVQNEYSFWTRDPEPEILPTCEELGIGFVPWSPLGMGYLTGTVTTDYAFSSGDIRRSLGFPRFTDEALIKNRSIVTLLEQVGELHQATSGQVSLAWLMDKKPFIVPIPGTRLIPHMLENNAARNIKLTSKDIEVLESGFRSIGVFGDRAPERLKASHDIGTSLGTSSKGTRGKTPLPTTD